MACYRPLDAWWSRERNENGNYYLVFNPTKGFLDKHLKVPCGQCIGCRLANSVQWATRMMHEAQENENNHFITLTYDNENLPKDGSLCKKHMQDFHKRLRDKFKNHKIKMFYCGEYGDKSERPHYHGIYYNLPLDDLELHTTIGGNKLYTSKTIERLWGQGFTPIGNVTFESSAYVARYITKKLKGKGKFDKEFKNINLETGELTCIHEYANASQKLGISWLEKYHTDVYPSDFVLINGRKCRPPKAYDLWYEKHFPKEYAKVKAKRINSFEQYEDNNTRERLAIREEVQQRKLDEFAHRKYEKGLV